MESSTESKRSAMKTVLVTGGNRGIGLQICRELDKLGHQIIMGSRDLEKGKKAASQFSKNIIVKQLDVTDEESILHLFDFIKTDIGKLDVLINNAGLGATQWLREKSILSSAKNILETRFTSVWKVAKTLTPLLRKTGVVAQKETAGNVTLANVKYLMETNFYGPWRMMQVFIPLLLKSKNGRVINISSGMGELGSLNGEYPAYSLSKTSLNALTIMFSNELKEQGVSVNAMCPGWVKTDMGGPDAPREVSEGADTAVWLTTEKEIPTGIFFRDRNEINW